MTKKVEKTASEDVSPALLLQRDFEILRKEFRATVKTYAAQVESDITDLVSRVEKEGAAKKISAERMRDFRDVSAAIQKLKIKPQKGRRKDLKKIDLLVADLKELTSSWSS